MRGSRLRGRKDSTKIASESYLLVSASGNL
jgi:hypothetical protein